MGSVMCDCLADAFAKKEVMVVGVRESCSRRATCVLLMLGIEPGTPNQLLGYPQPIVATVYY